MVFEHFRKRQKVMMVCLTVMAMFAFVLASAFDQYIGGSNSQFRDSPFASAWGKNIMASEVYKIQEERGYASEFIRQAIIRTGSRRMFQGFDRDERSILADLVILGKAKQMGMGVEDARVTEFLHDVTNGKLSTEDFFQILQGIPDAQGKRRPIPINDRELYRIIGREILIRQTVSALLPAVVRVSPYDYFEQRASGLTRIQLEIAKIPVRKFVPKDAEPDDKQLQETYDKYKDVEPEPENDVIGFKIPRQIDAQYLMADASKFADKVQVSEAEIEEYYKENQAQFQIEPAPPLPPAGRNLPGPPVNDVDIPLPPSTPGKAEPKAATPPAPQPSAPPATPKADPAPATPTDAPKPAVPAEKPAEKPAGGSYLPGIRGMTGVAGLSTYLLQDDAAKKTDAPATPEKKDPVPPADAKKDVAPPEVKKEEPKAESKPATSVPAPPVDVKSPPTETKGSAPALPPPATIKPLAEVKDEIVKRLREEKARKLLIEKMDSVLQTQLNPYLDGYMEARSEYRRTAPKGKDGDVDMSGFKPPAPPDLEKIAKENGFELKTTGLVDEVKASEIPLLGKATKAMSASDFPETERFSQMVFVQSNYRGRVLQDPLGKTIFLYWKTVDQPARVPPLSEVKSDVVNAWRLSQAEPKAKEEAQAIKKKLVEAGGDFAKAVPKETGYTVETTDLFPRKVRRLREFTGFNPFLDPEIEESPKIVEIPDAGEVLLNAAFKLKVGDIDVLEDAAGRNFYVVKVKQRILPDFQNFVSDFEMQMERGPDQPDRFAMEWFTYQRQKLMKDLQDEAGLKLLESIGSENTEG